MKQESGCSSEQVYKIEHIIIKSYKNNSYSWSQAGLCHVCFYRRGEKHHFLVYIHVVAAILTTLQ